MSFPAASAPPPLGAPPPLARIVHAPRVLGGGPTPVGGLPGGPGGGRGGPPGGPMGISQVELRKNLNEALLKRTAKAHHSAPGNIGPLGFPPAGGQQTAVGQAPPVVGGAPQLPVRERGSSTSDAPSYHSPILTPYHASPPLSPSLASPSSPALPPPVLPPRDFLPPLPGPPTVAIGAAPSASSPLRRPPTMMLQHAATSHSPMIRSTGALPIGILAGGGGASPLRAGSTIVGSSQPHSNSDHAVHLNRSHSVVGAIGHRRSVSTDEEPSGDRRDSGTWIHKRSLSSLVPRLGELPTDPSLFEKAADTKKLGMKFEKCFTGEMFVEWVQSLGNGHTKQEISELGEMLIKSTLIIVLAGSETFGTSKYDVYALNDISLGGGMGSSLLASAMGSLSLNKKEQKKKEKLEKREEEKRLKEVKKQEKAELKAKNKSNKSLDKKKPKKKANKVFNVSLEEVLAQQQGETADPELAAKYAGLDVPVALKLLSDRMLELNACRTEGIFRISGTQEEIDKLKAQINDLNYDAIAICDDVNVVAGLLKAFLRELPEPLIPANLYERCITEGLTSPARANQLLQELPEANLKISRFVLNFLLRFLVPEHVAVTKMGIENVSMVFAPLFLRNETSDPTRMLLNASYESSYVQNLIQHCLSSGQQ